MQTTYLGTYLAYMMRLCQVPAASLEQNKTNQMIYLPKFAKVLILGHKP